MSFVQDLLYQLSIFATLITVGVLILFVIYWAWKNDYLKYLPMYDNLRNELKQQASNNSVNMLSVLSDIFPSNTGVGTPVTFEANKDKTYIIGKITYNLKEYNMILPLDNKLAKKMQTKKVYLVMGSEKVDITQVPGVTYHLTPRQLGGDKIIVKNLNGQNFAEVEADQLLSDVKEFKA